MSNDKTLKEQLEQALGIHAGTALGLELRHYLTRLGETNDLNWIDLMVWRLTEEEVPLPKVIQDLAARAAYLRLHGAGRRRGNVSKVMAEHAKSLANVQIAFLRGAFGEETKDAAERAANATYAELGHAGMASTRTKEFKGYAEENPAANLLEGVGRAWADVSPEQKAALADYLTGLKKRAPGRRR